MIRKRKFNLTQNYLYYKILNYKNANISNFPNPDDPIVRSKKN